MLSRRTNFPTLFSEGEGRPQRQFSDLLDEVMEDALSMGRGTFVPELNVYETDGEFEITLALPGMSKDDITISLEDHTLVISGERSFEEEEERTYHRVESGFGKFERSLPLPNNIDTENINASYENGVLSISIPKVKGKTGKQIEVS